MSLQQMDYKEALKIKVIFYSLPFVEKFGDWMSVQNRMYSLPEKERTDLREGIVAFRFKVTIPLNEQYEPMLIPRVWEFVLQEYESIYNKKERELEVFDPNEFYKED